LSALHLIALNHSNPFGGTILKLKLTPVIQGRLAMKAKAFPIHSLCHRSPLRLTVQPSPVIKTQGVQKWP
jgi:hypothetical protein